MTLLDSVLTIHEKSFTPFVSLLASTAAVPAHFVSKRTGNAIVETWTKALPAFVCAHSSQAASKQ